MNVFSVAIAGLFALLSVAFLLFLIAAIVHNLRTGIRYREAIARQLSRLRLGRMLGIHGIGQGAYLHAQPILDIRDQMKHCSECASTERCDKFLDEGDDDKSEFCENDEALRKVRKTLDPVS